MSVTITVSVFPNVTDNGATGARNLISIIDLDGDSFPANGVSWSNLSHNPLTPRAELGRRVNG